MKIGVVVTQSSRRWWWLYREEGTAVAILGLHKWADRWWEGASKGPNAASYLLFNLAPVCEIRLMAVKWLRHAHCPSAGKAPGRCAVSKAKKEK